MHVRGHKIRRGSVKSAGGGVKSAGGHTRLRVPRSTWGPHASRTPWLTVDVFCLAHTLQVCEVLLEAKADPTLKTHDGESPLWVSARHGYVRRPVDPCGARW